MRGIEQTDKEQEEEEGGDDYDNMHEIRIIGIRQLIKTGIVLCPCYSKMPFNKLISFLFFQVSVL